MKKKLVLILIVILSMSLFACSKNETHVKEKPEPKKEITNIAETKDWVLEILDGEFIIDEEGDKALQVNFKFTNNSDEMMSAYSAVRIQGIQNDEEVEIGLNSSSFVEEIRNGKSKDFWVSFKLKDDSDVEVNITNDSTKAIAKEVFTAK